MHNLIDVAHIIGLLFIAYAAIVVLTLSWNFINKVFLEANLKFLLPSKKSKDKQCQDAVSSLMRTNVSMAIPLNQKMPFQKADEFETVPAYVRAGYIISNGIMLKPAAKALPEK